MQLDSGHGHRLSQACSSFISDAAQTAMTRPGTTLEEVPFHLSQPHLQVQDEQ